MTARQLYEHGCNLVYEIPDDDEDILNAFPFILNHIMAICTPYENQFRFIRGQQKIGIIPKFDGWDIDIPFCDEIVSLAMPYAVQSKFLEVDDDKKAEAVMAYNKFIEILNSITPAVEVNYA